MSLKKQSRNYSGSLHCTTQQKALLTENFENWQKVFAIAYDRIATLCGSYVPCGELFPDKVPAEILELIKNTLPSGELPLKNKWGTPTSNPERTYRTILAFINWFPAESTLNPQYEVTWQEAVHRFKTYWDVKSLGQYDPDILACLSRFNLRGKLIDRHRQFNDETGLTPLMIKNRVFAQNRLNFQGAFNKNAQAWRNVISVNFGTGGKGNPSWDYSILTSMVTYLKTSPEEIRPSELRNHLAGEGLWPVTGVGKRGASPFYVKRIAASDDHLINVKTFSGNVEKRLKNAKKTANSIAPPSPVLRAFLIDPIEKLGLFKFENNNELFYAAYSQPWGQICSHRSNCVHRIVAQYCLYLSNQALIAKVPTEIDSLGKFCTKMTDKLGIEHPYTIREHQDNGLKHFLKYVEEGLSCEDALEKAAESLNGRALKNSNRDLLSYIYEVGKDSHYDVAKWQDAVKWHYQEEKLHLSALGAVANVIERPLRPLYGKSKPYCKITLSVDNPAVEILLITNSGLTKETFAFSARRALKELITDPQAKLQIPRNTKHHNPDNKPAQLHGDYENSAIAVYSATNAIGIEKWYISIIPQISYLMPSNKKLNPATYKVLGIDLGWRKAAAYTVLHKGKAIEEGFLDASCSPEGTTKQTSLFGPSKKASVELLNFYRELVAELFPEDKEQLLVESSHSSTVRKICSLLRKKMFSSGIDEKLLGQVKSIVDCVSPSFSSHTARSYVAGQGKLNSDRLDMLKNMKRMLCQLQSIAKRNNIILDNFFSFATERITKKEINLKTERARITGRMILKKAVESQCNVIGLEDLEVSSSRRKNKWMNTGIANWYCTRIIKFLEGEAPMHGIRVIKVSPNYSSHQDENGNPSARMEEINPQTLPEKTARGKMYSSINSIQKRLKSYSDSGDSETELIYQEASRKFLGEDSSTEILDKAKQNGVESMYIPRRGGEWNQVSNGTIKHSDVIASHVIAKRAIERLVGKKKPLATRKTTKKTVNGKSVKV